MEQSPEHYDAPRRPSLAIPVAIVVAGALIAGAIYLVNRQQAPQTPQEGGSQATAIEVPPVTVDDHILGNPEAPIVVIEYSDTECPFCKDFHTTMHRVIDEYGRNGQVAWVYRHFPIVQLHARASYEAEATECAAELGGNAGFWAYIDRVFEVTPSNDGLDPAQLPEIAVEVGLDEAAFTTCLESRRYQTQIEDDVEEGIAVGRSVAQATNQNIGTPLSIIVAEGQTVPIVGAQPYRSMKAAIDSILTQLGSKGPENN